MKGKRAEATSVPGPQRWSFRNYSIRERASPTGRRFEVTGPNAETILFCRARRKDPRLVFYADAEEGTELFSFEPRKVRQFQRSYEAIDARSGQSFGQVRKRVYAPLNKTEWFMFDTDGNQVGLVTETAGPSTFVRRFLPVDRFLPKSWAIHWGQFVAGSLQPKPSVMGERLDVDLRFDTRDEIDRRLVIGSAIALRVDDWRPEKGPKPEPTPDVE